MHQPIFASDTGFLKPFPDGRRLVPGSEEPDLGGGARVEMLATEMNLVRVETDIGVSVAVTPETFFSFTRQDGNVLLYVPVELTLTMAKTVTWPGLWAGADDPRRWWIIGAIHAGGAFSSEQNRPARLILPSKLADDVEDYLRRISINPNFRIETIKGFHAVTRSNLDDGTAILTSRIIDKLIGSALLPGSKHLLFIPDLLPVDARHAFLSGVLAGMTNADGKLVFRSRYADVVRTIHRVFMETAGLFSTLSINPMEPEIQKSTRVAYPHHCFLDEDALKAAHFLRLLPSKSPPPVTVGYRTVKIVDAVPIGKHAACTVIAPPSASLFVANWFVSRAEFTLPEAADIAAHPILVNPANFEEVNT